MHRCCIPPPFPDDFYPVKDWFVWRDAWYEESRCDYLSTVPDALVFVLRTVTKIGRSVTDDTVTLWPYSAMERWVWSIAAFPDNEWPGTYFGMAACVTLNTGSYILALVIITLAVIQWDVVTDVVSIHVMLGKDAAYRIRESTRKSDLT